MFKRGELFGSRALVPVRVTHDEIHRIPPVLRGYPLYSG